MLFDELIWIAGIAIAALLFIVPMIKKKSKENSNKGDPNQNYHPQHDDHATSGDSGGGDSGGGDSGGD